MIWQDLVITIAVLLMSYALIPQVIRGFKTKKALISIQTAAITSIALYSISFVYFTLNLYFASGMNLLTGILWTILLIQSIIYSRSKNQEQELRPEYLEKLKKIRKEDYTKFNSIEDLRKNINKKKITKPKT